MHVQANGLDLLFPSRAIEPLHNLRGESWEKLMNSLIEAEPASLERIAFVLMMVRISGCTNCQSDSFRAMRGCVVCSSTTIKRYKGTDQNLIELFGEAKIDVIKYLEEA